MNRDELTALFSRAAHEANSPLTTAQQLTDLLLADESLSDSARQHVEHIRAAVMRTAKMVDKVMHALAAGNSGASAAPFDLSGMLRFIRERMRMLVECDITIHTGASLPRVLGVSATAQQGLHMLMLTLAQQHAAIHILPQVVEGAVQVSVFKGDPPARAEPLSIVQYLALPQSERMCFDVLMCERILAASGGALHLTYSDDDRIAWHATWDIAR
jgi:signal transduction histidine kinase